MQRSEIKQDIDWRLKKHTVMGKGDSYESTTQCGVDQCSLSTQADEEVVLREDTRPADGTEECLHWACELSSF